MQYCRKLWRKPRSQGKSSEEQWPVWVRTQSEVLTLFTTMEPFDADIDDRDIAKSWGIDGVRDSRKKVLADLQGKVVEILDDEQPGPTGVQIWRGPRSMDIESEEQAKEPADVAAIIEQEEMIVTELTEDLNNGSKTLEAVVQRLGEIKSAAWTRSRVYLTALEFDYRRVRNATTADITAYSQLERSHFLEGKVLDALTELRQPWTLS
ncbi:unnamed protein product [Durusdinium trenchii]|uniref:Uncharacterized protein n=1 Tax=Durusdinium trenchii TaxID=1381693 RepID=A0ABP0I844_9DINO